jgi:hypothetical protein
MANSYKHKSTGADLALPPRLQCKSTGQAALEQLKPLQQLNADVDTQHHAYVLSNSNFYVQLLWPWLLAETACCCGHVPVCSVFPAGLYAQQLAAAVCGQAV